MAGLASSRVKDTTATKDMGNGESLQRQHEKPVAVVWQAWVAGIGEGGGLLSPGNICKSKLVTNL